MAEITIKCVEGNPLAINVVMTAIEHSMLNGEMVTETVDFYPDTTKPVRAVLDCTTARRQYCPQTSVTDNVVYVSDNGSVAAGVYTLTITCTDTQGKKRRYKSDPCIEVYDATSAAEIAATFDSQAYELNGVFYTFAGGGGTVQADWNETDPNNPSYILNKPDLSEYATDEELQDVEESIPDVPAWALQPQKPTYTAGEVGAVPTTRKVNGKALSQDITLNANDVGAQPAITDLGEIRSGASAGATAYQKPSGGIPKSDLATAVQASLNKADTALQSYTESDPVFSASPAAHITNEDITSWNDKSDFSGSYNDLSDKPTIPAAQVQSDWNQTNTSAKDYIKNKPTIPHGVVVDNALSSTSENPVQNKVINNALNGKQGTISDLSSIRSGASAGATAYQKPSGGIPKSDLASAVQTSLNKADTALQSYTESDPVFTASPAHGITAADITAWNGKASKVAIVNHGTGDTTFTLTPNIFHVWGTVTSLTLTLATASTTTMDEFMFQFTSGTTATTLSLPSTVKWVAEPEIKAGMTYQVSIVNNIAVIGGVS